MITSRRWKEIEVIQSGKLGEEERDISLKRSLERPLPAMSYPHCPQAFPGAQNSSMVPCISSDELLTASDQVMVSLDLNTDHVSKAVKS